MKIETATVVWGQSYIEDFFNLSLKSLIIDENISFIKNQSLIINVIFKESEKDLVDTFLEKENNNLINVIYYPDTFFQGNKYECHSNIIKNLIKDFDIEDYIFFYYPDMILSKNFIKNIFNFNKFDVVFFTAPRIKKENFVYNFTSKIISNGIDEKILNKFIINNLHIKMHLMNVDSKYFNGAISWLINLNEYGMIIKSFHQTPLIIKRKIVDTDIINLKIGIDDYLSEIKLGPVSKIIEDSEKFSWCSFENDSKELYQETNVKLKSIIEWISTQTTDYQRKNFLISSSYFVKDPQNMIKLKKFKYKKNFLNILRLVKNLKLFQIYFKIFNNQNKKLSIIK